MRKVLMIVLVMLPLAAWAQLVAAPAVPVVSDLDFLTQLFNAVKAFGGLGALGKLALVISLVIGSMRVTFLAPLWDKLPGAVKPWMAPLLAALVGFLSLSKFDGATLLAFMMTGGGSVLLDNVLDGIKSIPGIGAGIVALINFLEALPVIGKGQAPKA